MRHLSLAALVVVLGAAGCGGGATSQLGPGPEASRSQPSPQPSDFIAWRDQFRRQAIAQGIEPGVFDAAFAGVGVNPTVVRLDGKQAEFTKPIWDYLDSAASPTRVETGRANAARLGATLDAIEARYGVDGQAVLAIWGMETNYGRNRGDIPVIEGLATLAYDGRRRAFAEEQLVDALRILQSGDTTPARMVGSWAGAMGHTQFMPSSYLAYAVDFNGDGRRDVWSDDPTDALASAANYLAHSGWEPGQPWGLEVHMPPGFDYARADQKNRQPVSYWRARGVTLMDGRPLPDHGEGAIIAPAGARGPTFIVFRNFYVIKRYNNATSYAMGVGHLGDRIAGASDFVAAWPRDERELSRTEKVELQERLMAAGYHPGSTDGVIGPDTTNAIRGYQSARGMTPDGFATASLLERLR
ncbi:lytic murein transglycosylase [Amaricoccus solimangrovi]|uniref:Lytic murein transglycosylase n=1 Tax=Amaricoccus solimangrovi TaxID=2589815 RepID=A0A501WNG2_9RHOB|nr:lytic murein transglycosylase [Amaricoccus solimangrovi]TPE48827.1 lytic murein transglycosylase [Amaricoccus solimangrovi]